jgi:hypothetical protein
MPGCIAEIEKEYEWTRSALRHAMMPVIGNAKIDAWDESDDEEWQWDGLHNDHASSKATTHARTLKFWGHSNAISATVPNTLATLERNAIVELVGRTAEEPIDKTAEEARRRLGKAPMTPSQVGAAEAFLRRYSSGTSAKAASRESPHMHAPILDKDAPDQLADARIATPWKLWIAAQKGKSKPTAAQASIAAIIEESKKT